MAVYVLKQIYLIQAGYIFLIALEIVLVIGLLGLIVVQTQVLEIEHIE
jgi:hypothetical protein